MLLKRALDILLPAVCLLVCLPFIPLFWVLIKLDSPGPMFFKQKRAGRNGTTFTLYKLRTMRSDAPSDVATHLMTGSHITTLGAFLRRSSLDELPQLWNILKGDMSIVGPRPALWNQYDLIEMRDKNGASSIRPGLTGLAQIMGRDELLLEVKAAYDGEYAQKMCFKLDLTIIIKTAAQVLRGRGIKEGGG